MKSGRFDECCPKCEAKIDIYEHFMAADCNIVFGMDCPACEEELIVTVHTVPEFEIFTGEEIDKQDAEDKARREAYHDDKA